MSRHIATGASRETPEGGKETLEKSEPGHPGAEASGAPVPGMVLCFSAGKPMLYALPVPAGGVLSIGRGNAGGLPLDDDHLSRQHAEVGFVEGRFIVRDLDSRNGTQVDGTRVSQVTGAHLRLLMTGNSLFLLEADVRPFQLAAVHNEPTLVMGPRLARIFEAARVAAQAQSALHITGESGSGKERLAEAFHRAGPRASGPLVAVNCAAVPSSLAERLFFGARKGAFSGASEDAQGYVQAAARGTLFLDEVAELDPQVQAKLLRVLETREVLPLGASRAQRVELSICSATHADLRALVGMGRFREDLYFRIGRPELRIPPLRERREEIPWLIARAVQASGATLAIDGPLVEACLLREWPGNVRELTTEIIAAVQAAVLDRSRRLEPWHLSPTAGRSFTAGQPGTAATAATATVTTPLPGSIPEGGRVTRPRAVRPRPDREEIAAALAAEQGKIAPAARRLGIHRTQLKRWMERFGLSGGDDC